MKNLAAIILSARPLLIVGCFLFCLSSAPPLRAASAIPFAPSDLTIGRAHELSLAFTDYSEDNNENFPPMTSAAAFDAALAPYVHDSNAYYSADTGQPFVPNAALTGNEYGQLAAQGPTPIFQDDPTGQSAVVAFLDGHIEYGGVETGDPVQVSLSRARALVLGVAQYSQDNNETLPDMETQSAFETAIEPYVIAPFDFTDNLTGQYFIPNADLSGMEERSITQNPATVPVVSDLSPAPDGLTTIAYLDGHAVHGAAVQPVPSATDSIKDLGLAIEEYIEDYNETLPPLDSETALEAAVTPYIGFGNPFLSPSGLPYNLNSSLSGESIADISNPSQVWLLADTVENPNGTLNTVFVDGQEQTTYAFVPVGLATGRDNFTRLVWGKANGVTAITILSPSGNRLAFQSNPAAAGPLVGIAVASDATARLLFNSGGGLEYLQSVSSGGSPLATSDDGPYDGWTPLGVTVTPSDQTVLLWQRYDGTTVLEYFSSAGIAQNSVVDATPSGFQAIAIASSAAGDARVLFGNGAGSLTIWDDLSSGQTTTTVPTQGGSPVALAVGPDNQNHVLLTRPNGSVIVLTVSPAGVAGAIQCPPFMTWTAVGLSVDAGNNTHILWRNQVGTACIRTYSPHGSFISVQTYPAPQ
jgi:hypothetical protein